MARINPAKTCKFIQIFFKDCNNITDNMRKTIVVLQEKSRTKNGILGVASIIREHFHRDIPTTATFLILGNEGIRLKIWPEIHSNFALVKKTSLVNHIKSL